jgi:mannan endo-1,4-beta-mannosidase
MDHFRGLAPPPAVYHSTMQLPQSRTMNFSNSLRASIGRLVEITALGAFFWLSSACRSDEVSQISRERGFVGASGTHFTLDGKPYFVAGVNNHYVTFGEPSEVRAVMDDAVAMKASVVRTFIQPVIGSLDGVTVPTIWDWKNKSETSNLGVNGVYMLYWDTARNRPAFNDGPNGMQRFDFLVAEAAKRDLKLIVAFLDFWAYTGGAQQMRAWYGSNDKGTFFFSDPRTKQDYKDWIRHVLERVNPLTKIAYKDDPTIFAWELMNEPNIEPAALYISWVSEMSAYVKSIDRNHLVSSGHARISDLPIASIDFGTWHGYPQYENLPADTYDRTIRKFCEIARDNNKPVLLEEFGYPRFKPGQADIYRIWLETIHQDPDCAGWLVWRLVSHQRSGRYPADTYDGFDIHREGGATWDVLRKAAANIQAKSLDLR